MSKKPPRVENDDEVSLDKRASSDLIGEGGISQTSERKATSSPSNWGMGDADGPQQRMEEDGRMELIHVAIQQLLAQKRNEKKNKKEADDDDDEQLLSRLLLQLESLKKETGGRQCESLVGMKEQSPAAVKVETSRKSEEIDVRKKETKSEEIVKELKQVKRQNTITHWLLTGMMVLIAAWQFSEVKLFLKVKNKVTDPFRSVENMITGAQDTLKHLDGHEQDAAQKNHSAELNSKSALKVPDLLNMDLPVLGLHGGEKQD